MQSLIDDTQVAKDLLLHATFVESKHLCETWEATLKQTILLASPILVTYVEKYPGQEMHLGCIRIICIRIELIEYIFRTKQSLRMHKFRQHNADFVGTEMV